MGQKKIATETEWMWLIKLELATVNNTCLVRLRNLNPKFLSVSQWQPFLHI